MINNIFAKRKTKRGKSNVDEYDNLWVVICCDQFSSKYEPVGMINDPISELPSQLA